MNKYLKYIITASLFIAAAVSFVLFEILKISIVNDVVTNILLTRAIYHTIIVLLIVWIIWLTNTPIFTRFDKNFPKQLLWTLPCFLVAFVNFPISGLITDSVTIVRMDLMALYILYVTSIAFIEELVFRGILLLLLLDFLRYKKYRYTLAALFSSLIFALFHLTNLFMGMDIVSVLLQVVYTFLIGGMFSVIVLKTKNIWLCIIIHAIFDFGGLLTEHIAVGNPWDVTFWILTITCGILCAGHIIVSLINLERKYVS